MRLVFDHVTARRFLLKLRIQESLEIYGEKLVRVPLLPKSVPMPDISQFLNDWTDIDAAILHYTPMKGVISALITVTLFLPGAHFSVLARHHQAT